MFKVAGLSATTITCTTLVGNTLNIINSGAAGSTFYPATSAPSSVVISTSSGFTKTLELAVANSAAEFSPTAGAGDTVLLSSGRLLVSAGGGYSNGQFIVSAASVQVTGLVGSINVNNMFVNGNHVSYGSVSAPTVLVTGGILTVTGLGNNTSGFTGTGDCAISVNGGSSSSLKICAVANNGSFSTSALAGDSVVTTAGRFLVNANGSSTSTLIVNSGGVIANSSTPSTSTSTGALIVPGGLGVGGYIYAGGVVAAGGLSTNGTAFFDYDKGNWTPNLFWVHNDGNVQTGTSTTYTTRYGRYEKVGDEVTLHFVIIGTSSANSGVGTSFPFVNGLPYRCNGVITQYFSFETNSGSESQWQTGIEGIPGLPYYPPPYTLELHELGYPQMVAGTPLPGIFYTYDGYTMGVYGTRIIDILLDEPLITYGLLDNFYFTNGLTKYNFGFVGTIVYITD